MTKVRNHHFDNIKAVLIFLVVFGHLIEPLRDFPLFKALYFIIYSFHMPIFIFLAGYFVKPITKGLKKMWRMFLKYEIIYAVIFALLFASQAADAPTLGILGAISYFLQPIWVLWFLFSLIIWRLLLIGYEKHPYISIIIITLIIAFNFIPFNFRILSLGRSLTFFPYYLLGYLAKKHSFDFKRIELNRIGGLLLVLALGIFWYLFSISIKAELLYGATSLIIEQDSLLWLAIFKLICYFVAIGSGILLYNIVPKKELYMSAIGQQTLPIYLWHPILIWLLMRVNFFEVLGTFNAIFSLILLLIISALMTVGLKDRRV